MGTLVIKEIVPIYLHLFLGFCFRFPLSHTCRTVFFFFFKNFSFQTICPPPPLILIYIFTSFSGCFAGSFLATPVFAEGGGGGAEGVFAAGGGGGAGEVFAAGAGGGTGAEGEGEGEGDEAGGFFLAAMSSFILAIHAAFSSAVP